MRLLRRHTDVGDHRFGCTSCADDDHVAHAFLSLRIAVQIGVIVLMRASASSNFDCFGHRKVDTSCVRDAVHATHDIRPLRLAENLVGEMSTVVASLQWLTVQMPRLTGSFQSNPGYLGEHCVGISAVLS